MIYDHILTVYTETAGTPLQHTLTQVGQHYYAPAEVYHARYWESVQAGSRIDMMVQLPFGGEITATQYVILEDNHVYRVEQAQHGKDSDGREMTTLSLRRMEGNYDVARP